MRVKLLKRLRRKIYCNLSVHRNDSKFTINWTYLSVMFKGNVYKTERKYGKYDDNVFKTLLKELEYVVLKDYIVNNILRRVFL